MFRDMLENPRVPPPSLITKTLLLLTSRSENVNNTILPALDDGKVVVSDRYIDSTVVYQGAEGLDVGTLRTLNSFATDNLVPDLTILLQVEPDIAKARILSSGAPDEMEASMMSRISELNDRYVNEIRHTTVLIDANQPVTQVLETIREVLVSALADHVLGDVMDSQ